MKPPYATGHYLVMVQHGMGPRYIDGHSFESLPEAEKAANDKYKELSNRWVRGAKPTTYVLGVIMRIDDEANKQAV